jgi:hypothetical protein
MARGEREQFTAWITKYALTKGILEKRVELCADISETMVSVIGNGWREHYHGKDWHHTRGAAVERAKQMQTNKLDSLHDQMGRVAGLDFT